MGLIELASGSSLWRGYDYYEAKRVKDVTRLSKHEIEGKVSGSNRKSYATIINTEHPRTSKCSCPHTNGRRVICKHMVALYFTAYPEEAKKLLDAAKAYEIEEEKRQEERENAVVKYISRMKKEDLQQTLLALLFDGPEWQYDRFVREHIGQISAQYRTKS